MCRQLPVRFRWLWYRIFRCPLPWRTRCRRWMPALHPMGQKRAWNRFGYKADYHAIHYLRQQCRITDGLARGSGGRVTRGTGGAAAGRHSSPSASPTAAGALPPSSAALFLSTASAAALSSSAAVFASASSGGSVDGGSGLSFCGRRASREVGVLRVAALAAAQHDEHGQSTDEHEDAGPDVQARCWGSDQLGLCRVWVMGDVLPPDRAYGRDNIGPDRCAGVTGTTKCF